jgi:hypothetical protein
MHAACITNKSSLSNTINVDSPQLVYNYS